MEHKPFEAMAKALRAVPNSAGELIVGTVTSWPTAEDPRRPHKLIAGGNTQEREDLMKSDLIGAYDLTVGDTVLVAPMEEAQRYLILCKVVAV